MKTSSTGKKSKLRKMLSGEYQPQTTVIFGAVTVGLLFEEQLAAAKTKHTLFSFVIFVAISTCTILFAKALYKSLITNSAKPRHQEWFYLACLVAAIIITMSFFAFKRSIL